MKLFRIDCLFLCKFVLMKRIIILVAAVSLLFSCSGGKNDPAKDAVARGIAESIKNAGGGDVSMYFSNFELIDSTTVGTELLNRKATFELKKKQLIKYYSQYVNDGKSSSATAKKDQLLDCEKYLTKIDSLYEALGDKVNDIAYYDYKFSGKAGNIAFDEGYACLTPDYEVLTIKQGSKDGLHKGVGAVVPGYKEILSKDNAE